MTWIEEHPNATRLERIKMMAHDLVGCATGPSSFTLEWFGLPEDFEVTDEPIETCREFDAIAMQCENCGWWEDGDDVSAHDGECSDCASLGIEE